MGMALLMKHVVSCCQRREKFAVNFAVKAILSKMVCMNFKSGHTMHIAKFVTEDWPYNVTARILV